MKNFTIFILLFCASVVTLHAQDDNVILRAMKDEMDRSTKEIEYENHQKPFYISYTIDESKTFSVYSSLGAVWGARDFKTRDKNVRILVGDYEFNDESLDNNQFSEPSAHEIEMPLDDDYFGIRRSLWTSTDIVYKGAAQKFKKHQETLKEKNKPLSELPHRTFASIPKHTTILPVREYTIDQAKWENYCKELSGYFKEVEAVESSSVFVTFLRSVRYFVNSEGTTAIVPETIAAFHCSGQIRSKDKTPISAQVTKYARTLDDLPAIAELRKEVQALVLKLQKIEATESLEEDYSGPVLFIGEPVVSVFNNIIFPLTASNTLQGQDNYGGEFSGAESKLGKNYVNTLISVKATPSLETFEGKPVIGNVIMDAEGVKPVSELVLIDKGILKNLMNDRSLTKPGQIANGFNDGPGVLQVSLSNGAPVSALKEKLIATAKEAGLDFAIIVRGKASAMGQTEIYRVDVVTGVEKPLSPARMKAIQPKDLKRISGTLTQSLHHVPIGRNNVISAIVPEAILVEELEVSPFKMPSRDDVQYISSPLDKKTK